MRISDWSSDVCSSDLRRRALHHRQRHRHRRRPVGGSIRLSPFRGSDMDFSLAPEVESLRQRLRDFVEAEIIPLEADATAYDEHENIAPDRLEGLRAKARQAGLWALQMPQAGGGQTGRAWGR